MKVQLEGAIHRAGQELEDPGQREQHVGLLHHAGHVHASLHTPVSVNVFGHDEPLHNLRSCSRELLHHKAVWHHHLLLPTVHCEHLHPVQTPGILHLAPHLARKLYLWDRLGSTPRGEDRRSVYTTWRRWKISIK